MRPGNRQPRADQLMRIAQRVLAWERAPRASHVDITLLSAAAMHRTNARATGRRGLTDVIAYSLPQPDGRVVGDVYICPTAAAPPPRARPQAPRNGTRAGLREELVRLAVHGTLHVLGYDHPEGSGRTRSRMWRLQERYVKRILR
ncbi:MAG: rRNA maturation RNase YbeY [Gemmatimonadetes bacterium]|nr:MAG: rRNA maturation RNase YbeY [Gemmatimonadetes bacterium 13_1_20CM_4_66_11]PYP96326.1 MAG: rRNA maturation RNase YbeY [Gemmatimonadota bacterium]